MANSIRFRLQFWYAFVFIAVILGFAAYLFFTVRRTRLQEIELEIVASANALDMSLRTFPPHELESSQPLQEPRFPFPKNRPPPRRTPEERLQALEPTQWNFSSTPISEWYFGIWHADNSPMRIENMAKIPIQFSRQELSSEVLLHRFDDRYEAWRMGPRNTVIVVGQRLDHAHADLRVFLWQLTFAGTVMLFLGLLVGGIATTRILRPIQLISAAAAKLSGHNLSVRIPTDNDESEFSNLTEILNQALARIESAFDQQARFTADASHELRTPLTVMKSHIELALNKPRHAEEYQQTLQSCMIAVNRMNGIIESLLLLARADAGRLELSKQPVDFSSLVEESALLIQPLANKKSVAIHTRCQTAMVLGDPLALAQVLSNLLANAIHYNKHDGRIDVELYIARSTVVLKIFDTGCGIPEYARKHLFERFYRVDSARARTTGGTGLGLAICHSIVTAHEGEISCKSAEGVGSTFTVRLPLLNIEPESTRADSGG